MNECRIGLVNISLGVFSSAGSLFLYWFLTSSMTVFTNQLLRELALLSYFTFCMLFVGLSITLLGTKQFLAARATGFCKGDWPSLTSLAGIILGTRKYALTSLLAGVAYGAFYAVVSSIVIYRPDRDFAVEYFATIPSIVPTVCCDLPGFIPTLTIYLTNHLALLLLPANVILMVVVSAFVGSNMAFSRFAYDNKPTGIKSRWLGCLGAIMGLFTACPTCAGLFLGNMIQATGAELVAVTLANYQPMFLGLTIPMLFGSNYAIVRSLRHLLYGSCRTSPV